MKNLRSKLLYTLLLLLSVGCRTASFNFLGFFEKEISSKEKNDFVDFTIPEELLYGNLSIRTTWGYGEYFEETDKLLLYITNYKEDKFLPDSNTSNEVFYFNNVAFAEYTINVLYNNTVVYQEPLTFLNDESAQFEIVITTKEQETPIIKNLFTFDSEEISVPNGEDNSTVIAQVQNGNSFEEQENIVFRLVGTKIYKATTDDGGVVIFEDVEAGEYEIALDDTLNGITYNSSHSKLTINPKSQKDISIYTFEGEHTDTSQIIYGVIEDFDNQQVIEGATIEVLGTKSTKITKADGRFTLKVGAGPQLIKLSKNGYISNCIRIVAEPNTALFQSFYLVKPASEFVVGKNGLSKEINNDIQLKVPEGALNSDTNISITLLPEGVYFMGFQSDISIPNFHIAPSGLGFIKPISLIFNSIEGIDEYEEGETLLINVFSDGTPMPSNKLEAKKEGDKLIVGINKISSSYSLSKNSTIHPQNTQYEIYEWLFECRYYAKIASYEKEFPEIWCKNNPFTPQKKTVRGFRLAKDCWYDKNVTCNKCTKQARNEGVRFGHPYTCKKIIDCAAPNCKKSYLVVITDEAVSSGMYMKRNMKFRNGNRKRTRRLIRDKPLPRCWDWSYKWVNSTCCNGQKCNVNNPNQTNKCIEWYCDKGVCKSRPTKLSKLLAKNCYECNPETGKKGKYLCDSTCEKCVDSVCKPIKTYMVKTISTTTVSIHCQPASNNTNTVVVITETEVQCPIAPLPLNTNETKTIIGVHDCEKTIVTVTIKWSFKQITP